MQRQERLAERQRELEMERRWLAQQRYRRSWRCDLLSRLTRSFGSGSGRGRAGRCQAERCWQARAPPSRRGRTGTLLLREADRSVEMNSLLS